MKHTTQKLMLQVLAALVPGTIVLTYFLGAGILINILVAILAALVAESLCLSLRTGKPGDADSSTVSSQLKDGSAMVTAVLLALCLPPFISIWLVITGTVFAIVFGKHIYGGLGHNVFNPAMAGFAVLILSFPFAMSQWPALSPYDPTQDVVGSILAAQPGFTELISIKSGFFPIPDGISAATPLDVLKFRGNQTIEEVWSSGNGFHAFAGVGWGWVNLAFLGGGLYLLKIGVIQYRAPLAMLITLSVLATLFYDSGSSDSFGSPLFHLGSGGTMLAAFFVVTDPVTSPGGKEGQWIFGIGVGVITFVIRVTGAYPEGIAFAILLMNGATPLIDRLRLTPPAGLMKIKEVFK